MLTNTHSVSFSITLCAQVGTSFVLLLFLIFYSHVIFSCVNKLSSPGQSYISNYSDIPLIKLLILRKSNVKTINSLQCCLNIQGFQIFKDESLYHQLQEKGKTKDIHAEILPKYIKVSGYICISVCPLSSERSTTDEVTGQSAKNRILHTLIQDAEYLM